MKTGKPSTGNGQKDFVGGAMNTMYTCAESNGAVSLAPAANLKSCRPFKHPIAIRLCLAHANLEGELLVYACFFN